MSRTEELLQGLLNGESPDITPRSRKEKYLKNCCDKCGCDDLPTPRSREEVLLYQLAEKIANGGSGDNPSTPSTPSVTYISNGVNFYDYDGTLLHSYTVEEAQALTELPELPEREGLICQGWNWTLEDIKAHNRALDVGATYITDDGKTRIYIRLEEGRTSPMLGVCPNGTVTVDWGDGTEPDTLTGTSTSTVRRTPTHNYATAGEYVITLTVDGEMGILGGSSRSQLLAFGAQNTDNRGATYLNAIKKVELGKNVLLGKYAFYGCWSLSVVTIPNDVAFGNVERGFGYCHALSFVVMPLGRVNIPTYIFESCSSLSCVVLPAGTKYLENGVFSNCSSLGKIIIPETVERVLNASFNNCKSLAKVTLPNSITTAYTGVFSGCGGLSMIKIPAGVIEFEEKVFSTCYGIRIYDLSNHTTVPTLSNTNAFASITQDGEIRVPSALYEEWIAATNWANYADYIVAV